MRRTHFILLLILNIIALPAAVFPQSFQYNYLRADYSIIDQTHLRASWCFEEMASDHNFLEFSETSIALLQDVDNSERLYLSINPIPSAIGLLIGKRQKVVSDVLLLPQRIGNFKFQLPLSWTTVLYAGPNTDFYIVSEKLSVYSEITIGLKQEIGRFKASANFNLPFSQGPLENKDAFFSIGVGYVLKNARGG